MRGARARGTSSGTTPGGSGDWFREAKPEPPQHAPRNWSWGTRTRTGTSPEGFGGLVLGNQNQNWIQPELRPSSGGRVGRPTRTGTSREVPGNLCWGTSLLLSPPVLARGTLFPVPAIDIVVGARRKRLLSRPYSGCGRDPSEKIALSWQIWLPSHASHASQKDPD